MDTNIAARPRKAAPAPLNGVDTPMLFATINAVGAQPELAKFQFAASNQWVKGTHSQSVMHRFSGAGGPQQHRSVFQADADHPSVLCGADAAPTPVEWVLHALASCLTAGIANIAAARGIALLDVSCTVTGDIDLQGILGLSKEVRNGFQAIAVRFHVSADAPAEKVANIVRQAQARSAVFDILTNGVPIAITVNG
jgi:uncharacterized OsmC-like protein